MRKITSFAAALMLSGCATVVSGTSDDVKFDSKPAGAECTVYRSGEVVNRLKTPQTINVRRSGKPLLAVCEAGDLHGREVVESGHNWWWLGNMLFTAPPAIIVGLLVDGFSGAWRGYDDVTVKLN